jgi:hypothetical protein
LVDICWIAEEAIGLEGIDLIVVYLSERIVPKQQIEDADESLALVFLFAVAEDTLAFPDAQAG